MGKWITPKVVIEKFAPNQYVAVCSVDVPLSLRNVDIATGWAGYLDENGWGTPDNYHQFFESIVGRDGKTIQFDVLRNGDDDDPQPGWYRNVTFYSNYRPIIYVFTAYEYYGTSASYDIEVYRRGNNWYADVYITGTADAAASGKSPTNHS
ncbi:MAG: hypothetical protein E7185_09670 [Erysipelotrichaceae bacterium]|nr:hypothetical protein [Erysipelotrichaceae bacterium]